MSRPSLQACHFVTGPLSGLYSVDSRYLLGDGAFLYHCGQGVWQIEGRHRLSLCRNHRVELCIFTQPPVNAWHSGTDFFQCWTNSGLCRRRRCNGLCLPGAGHWDSRGLAPGEGGMGRPRLLDSAAGQYHWQRCIKMCMEVILDGVPQNLPEYGADKETQHGKMLHLNLNERSEGCSSSWWSVGLVFISVIRYVYKYIWMNIAIVDWLQEQSLKGACLWLSPFKGGRKPCKTDIIMMS